MNVIARDGEEAFLVETRAGHGRILDAKRRVFFAEQTLESIMAHGQWVPAELDSMELERLIAEVKTANEPTPIRKAKKPAKIKGIIRDGSDIVANAADLMGVPVKDLEHLRKLSPDDLRRRIREMESGMEKEVEYSGPVALDPICLACVHMRLGEDGYKKCTAFPGGIPDLILLGGFDHRSPYPGDNGVLFELAEGAELELEMFQEGKDRRETPKVERLVVDPQARGL